MSGLWYVWSLLDWPCHLHIVWTSISQSPSSPTYSSDSIQLYWIPFWLVVLFHFHRSSLPWPVMFSEWRSTHHPYYYWSLRTGLIGCWNSLLFVESWTNLICKYVRYSLCRTTFRDIRYPRTQECLVSLF